MKVYLHIGMSKAGSTAIQQCILQHEGALLQAGVCYPEATRVNGAHYKLFQALQDGGGADEAATVIAEAEAAHAARLIVSVEGLWLVNDDAVRRLAQALSGHDAEVVLYLRRPDTYLTSSYRQGIKRKRRTTLSEADYARQPHERLRYDRVLERWAEHFPLRVRAYEAVRSDLVGDFARATGTASVLSCPGRQRANVTPSDGSLRLMRLANRLIPNYHHGATVNRRLLAWQRAFAWMPALDDAPLVARARAEATRWEPSVMARHLAPEDLAAITPPAR